MNHTTPLVDMPSGSIVNGTNGYITDLKSVPQEQLEAELPFIHDGQIPLSELLLRVVQDIYAELVTLADTLPSSSDAARKRMLADFAVKHKKQVVKTFAVVRWAKDWKDVQKSMNITSFLMNQNEQFNDAANAITLVKDSYAAEKLRNHDILTSLDVLTTGTYQRLPTAIKKLIIPPKRLTNEEIERTLASFDHLIRYRLRMTEIIPVEMNEYFVASGQVHFRVANLFSVSLSLRGSEDRDPWFLVDVEFDINVGGDDTGVVAFPRAPTGITKQYIVDEADIRLSKYITRPEPDPPQQSEGQLPELSQVPSVKLPDHAVDAALVRLYNFLQMMSLSYQLEILHYQAQRMRLLGWADFLKVAFSKDRKTLTVAYWIRQPPPPRPQQLRTKVPLQGGTIVISIESKPPVAASRSTAKSRNYHPPGRSHKDRILHELGVAMKLQQQSSMEDGEVEKVPSDEVERLCLSVKWTPDTNALGFTTNPAEWVIPFEISANDLDFQNLLAHVVRLHAEAILKVFRKQLCEGPFRNVFTNEDVALSMDGNTPVLQILLCASELLIVTIDSRTGRFTLRGTGDLAAAGRGPRFAAVTEKINDNPVMILNAIIGLKYSTIVESAEQKAIALGLQTYRQRNMSRRELAKFGPQAHAHLFIQLHHFPSHYLVLVVGEDDFKHALVSVKTVVENGTASMVIEDIGWLEVAKIRGLTGMQVSLSSGDDMVETGTGMKRKVSIEDVGGRANRGRGREVVGTGSGRFKLESDVIRELYAYCCARVSHMRVEQQLKARGIPYTHVMSSTSNPTLRTSTLSRNAVDRSESIYSSLANSVPILCVQSKDILQGVPAAEAAMSNIRILPINWWSERKVQVVTCVKLKYVQPPVGKTARTGNNGKNHTVIRPSKSVIYDTREAIVSFLSEDVNTCVEEFLSEWARVSTIVVIAREVSQMAKAKQWKDVRLLSFDLQTVEFTYTTGYALSISCINQQQHPTSGSYQLRFLRVLPDGSRGPGVSLHDDASSFLRPLLRNGRLAGALAEMVEMLRDTLPMALELEKLIDEKNEAGTRMKVDVFPKSCGWYRVLMGDLRHALDFRLMKQKRVAILDASHSIFIDPKEGDDNKEDKEKERPDAIGVLKPIPKFAELLWDIGQSYRTADGGMAIIDIGLVCHTNVAGKIGLAVVNKVMAQLEL